MKNLTSLVVPNKNNNFRAILLKPLSLVMLAGIIFSFNFIVPVNNISAQTPGQEIDVESLLTSHNAIRKDQGLKELALNNKLNISAQRKADAMRNSDCWSHYCPNGKTPWEFFNEVGYDYVFAGENLAEGFFSIDKVMDAWMNSLTHRENILKKDFVEIGFGFAYGNFQGNPNNLIVVVHFGTETSNVQLSKVGFVSITSPVNGNIVNDLPVEIVGSANGKDLLNIYVNNNYASQVGVINGIFTYNLDRLDLGGNTLKVTSIDESSDEDSVSIRYEPVNLPSTSSRSISNDLKNVINLTAISFLGVLFLIDFLSLSRTHILGTPRAYSHKTFGVFFIIVIIVLVGGFGASLLEGVSTI